MLLILVTCCGVREVSCVKRNGTGEKSSAFRSSRHEEDEAAHFSFISAKVLACVFRWERERMEEEITTESGGPCVHINGSWKTSCTRDLHRLNLKYKVHEESNVEQ